MHTIVWYLYILVDIVIYKEVSQDWFLSLDLWPVNLSAALSLTGSLDWGIVRTNSNEGISTETEKDMAEDE